MSDLSNSLESLAPSCTQLSVSSYFDEAVFRREQALIFKQSARYVGHELAVPEVGDYLTLAHEGEGRPWCARVTGWSWCPTCAGTGKR